MKSIIFDEVFNIWMQSELDTQARGWNIIDVARSKGFSSITEWRLATALRLGMDQKHWTIETITNPAEVLPQVIIGPYKGWSQFFANILETTFAQAVEIPEFFEWCKTHDRINPIAENFPLPTTVILFRRSDGRFICIEGGHRICAVAYRQKLGDPIDFTDKPPVSAAIANISEEEVANFIQLLQQGTDKQKTP